MLVQIFAEKLQKITQYYTLIYYYTNIYYLLCIYI